MHPKQLPPSAEHIGSFEQSSASRRAFWMICSMLPEVKSDEIPP